MAFSQTIRTDVLIVGGGLAAVKAAYECGKNGMKTLVAIKTRLCSGASFYPLTGRLGCLAPRREDPADEDDFLEEINAASQGMNDPALARTYIAEIHDRIRELPEMGVDCHLMANNRIACFAQREREIYYWEDWNRTRGRISLKLAMMPEIALLERTTVIDLVKDGMRVVGAIAVNDRNELALIHARAVILATGGYGDLFRHNLNTPEVSGDGHVLAYRAGAQLANLEFIQFIPGYMAPKYKVLFGEPCLRFCTGLFDNSGRDILSSQLPAGLTAEACFRSRAGHGPFTSADESQYFDIAIMREIIASGQEDGVRITFDRRMAEDSGDHNYWYVQWMKQEMQIDLLQDRLAIAPFAHAANGGVVIDRNAWTGVPGLFAAGEIAGTMHGADRIGGCSSGNCLVFGKRAADSACGWAREQDPETKLDVSLTELWSKWQNNSGSTPVPPEQITRQVQDIMWRQAAIIRDEAGLDAALSEITAMKEAFAPQDWLKRGISLPGIIRAEHDLCLAPLVLTAMKARRESRGSHYRADFPRRNDRKYGRRMILKY